MSDLKKGDLVKFDVIDRHYSDDGIAVNINMRTHSNAVLTICEKINLDNFPSFNDFVGKQSEVNHGDLSIVLKKVGRPSKINDDEKWNYYDVYEILTKDIHIRQVFKWHLKKVED